MWHRGCHIKNGRMKTPPVTDDALRDLLQVARDLRDKNDGCPWDLEQTHESLAKHAIEEACELVEIIERGNDPANDSDLKEELGDVLFQVVIHAQLAAEEGRFTFADVARAIADKLVTRHPHVYGDLTVGDSKTVLRNWEAIKARERDKKAARAGGGKVSYLDGVPKNLAALQRAARLGEKAARLGFDWPAGEEGLVAVREKVAEELEELQRARSEGMQRSEEELGDLLFALAQYSRLLGIDPEGALRKACGKFESRFRFMEQDLSAPLSSGEKLSAETWNQAWEKAKRVQR
jgi:ATP diphosphatase